METQTPQQNASLKIDFRIVSAVLAVIIVGMLAWWRPWNDPRSLDRTIDVTGEAQLSAVPDEFAFTPSYEFKNADKEVALQELTKKSEEIVAKLNELGVPNEKIKTNSSAYDYPVYYENNTVPTFSLSFTITLSDKTLAQKVQDYLVTTTPLGNIAPQATFSNDKQKELENKAREEATKDARAKAEQSAKNLGFSLGQVKSVNDANGFGGGIAYPTVADRETASDLKLSIQPGENELTYSVTVVYYLR